MTNEDQARITVSASHLGSFIRVALLGEHSVHKEKLIEFIKEELKLEILNEHVKYNADYLMAVPVTMHLGAVKRRIETFLVQLGLSRIEVFCVSQRLLIRTVEEENEK